MRFIALTTGDTDGVGPEIAAKALAEIRRPRNTRISVFLAPSGLRHFRHLKKTKIAESFEDVRRDKSSDSIYLLPSMESPALWVEEVARLCLAGKADAMVTGPLSKPEIKKAGLNDLGHTDILKRISGRKKLWMSFWGSHFNVALVTGHIPLSEVPERWTREEILGCADAARELLKAWKPKHAAKPFAYLGLNPHAGDSGLIGSDEALMGGLGKNLIGPLVPDTAFQKANHKKFALFLAAYHDQGLIPFKLQHGFDEGVHVTLGLPFLRTSVDHGPAKDLVGTGKARHGSMRDALQMALDYKPAVQFKAK